MKKSTIRPAAGLQKGTTKDAPDSLQRTVIQVGIAGGPILEGHEAIFSFMT
jgi:hypothetical protein